MRSVYPEEEKALFGEWDKTVKAVTEPEKYDLSLYSLFERQNKKSHSPDCRLPANFNGKP